MQEASLLTGLVVVAAIGIIKFLFGILQVTLGVLLAIFLADRFG
jgi:hypothetical protein